MNRKLRNAMILLLPALLLALSGMIHPLLHSHTDENRNGTEAFHRSSGLHITDYGETICPVCSGELMTAEPSGSISFAINPADSGSAISGESFPHHSEVRIHNSRAPPSL